MNASWRPVALAALALTAAGIALLCWALLGSGPSAPDTSTSASSTPPAAATGAAPSAAAQASAAGTERAPTSPATQATSAGVDDDQAGGAGDPAWATPTNSAGLAAQRQDDAQWVGRATAFLGAYARPEQGVSRDVWWGGLAPALSAGAQGELAGVDPASVPFTRVIGPGSVVEPDPDSDSERVQVIVPTDAGWWLVVLDPDGKVAGVQESPRVIQ